MKTTFLKEIKVLQYGGRYFACNDRTYAAAAQAEWARKALAAPDVVLASGKSSRAVALEALEAAEFKLIDFRLITTTSGNDDSDEESKRRGGAW